MSQNYSQHKLFSHTKSNVCTLPTKLEIRSLRCSSLYRACKHRTSNIFAVHEILSLGRLLQTRFSKSVYRLGEIEKSENRAKLSPAEQQNLEVPPPSPGRRGGNLKILLLRRAQLEQLLEICFFCLALPPSSCNWPPSVYGVLAPDLLFSLPPPNV